MNSQRELSKKIRVSLGSAIVLKLLNGKLDAAPTTAYLMTYRRGKCTANCGFCPQARKSLGKAGMLSRVSWPVFPTELVISQLEEAVNDGKIQRVCLQALNYPEVFGHLKAFVQAIRRNTSVPISISCQPLKAENMRALKVEGVERIGIPLDAATEKLFDKVKGLSTGGPYSWQKQFELLGEAVKIFGKGKISTHLIVGLGETEKEMVETIQRCVDIGVLPALFAFTPIAGTALEDNLQPSIKAYRRIQMARYLIVHGFAKDEDMRFDKDGCITGFGVDKHALSKFARLHEPFLTSGCPNCNRPYYNEKPSGPIYNFPKNFKEDESAVIQKQLGLEET